MGVRDQAGNVDGGQVILNVGGRAGLKVGNQLNVAGVRREIKDPSTGKVIRCVASTVGVVRISEVDDLSAVAGPVSGAGIKVGDAEKPSRNGGVLQDSAGC